MPRRITGDIHDAIPQLHAHFDSFEDDIATGGGGTMTDVTAAPYSADNTGATDASAAIMDAIADGNKRIYLPHRRAGGLKGRYFISGAQFTANPTLFSLLEGVEFFGDGMGSTELFLPSSLTKGNNSAIIRIGGANVRVYDLTIIGADTLTNSFNQYSFYGIAIGSAGPHAKVYRVEIKNFNDNTLTAGAELISMGDGGMTQDISTTLGTTIAAGVRTVTPGSMEKIFLGRLLSIGGASPENVFVTALTATTFTATFVNAHNSTDAITGTNGGYTWAEISDCKLHDSFYATAFGIASRGNTIFHAIVDKIGAAAQQHGIYMSGGDNRVLYSEWKGIGGIAFHQYPTGNHKMDTSGNQYIGNTVIDPRWGFFVVYDDISDGTNPYVVSGRSLSRYALFQGNKFIMNVPSSLWEVGLNAYTPIIFDANILEGVVSHSFVPGSIIPLTNYKDGRLMTNALGVFGAQGHTIGGATLDRLGAGGPEPLSLSAESGFGGAPNNGYQEAFGGNTYIGAGIGRRLFTVLSNTAGAVELTITVDPVRNANGSGFPGAQTYTLESGVDFALGSDNTSPQLAVTAANLAFAIEFTIHICGARVVGADVYLLKPTQAVKMSITTDNASAVSATSGTDGPLELTGERIIARDGFVYEPKTLAERPTCDVSRRGMTWYEGGSSGENDLLFVCAKDNTDQYSWRQIWPAEEPPPPPDLNNGLLAYWKLDETSGTRVDSVGANDLTANNTPGNVTGIQGNAVHFDKTASPDQFLTITRNAEVGFDGGSFSIAGWIYLDSAAGTFPDWRHMISIKNEFDIFLNNDPWLRVAAGGAVISITPPATGGWHLVKCYFNADNGELALGLDDDAFSVTTIAGITGTSNEFCMGNISVDHDRPMDGAMDEWGKWDRVLGPTEWEQLYNSGAGATYPFA